MQNVVASGSLVCLNFATTYLFLNCPSSQSEAFGGGFDGVELLVRGGFGWHKRGGYMNLEGVKIAVRLRFGGLLRRGLVTYPTFIQAKSSET